MSEKAPRSIHSKNQGFVELGAWKIKRLRQAPTFKVSPWNAPETGQEHPSGTPCVNRDPLALAKFYKGLLDSGTVENRAALARYLGVSRSRVTQVLRRLEKAPKSATHNNDAAGRNGKPGKEDSHAEG